MNAGRRQVCEAWLKLSDSMSPGCWLLDWLLGMAEPERSHVPRLYSGLTYQILHEFWYAPSLCFCLLFFCLWLLSGFGVWLLVSGTVLASGLSGGLLSLVSLFPGWTHALNPY